MRKEGGVIIGSEIGASLIFTTFPTIILMKHKIQANFDALILQRRGFSGTA